MANEITVPLLPCASIDDRAAQILDGALARNADAASATELVEALAYRAELATRVDDPAAATDALRRARGVSLTDAQRAELGETLANLDDLEVLVRAPARG